MKAGRCSIALLPETFSEIKKHGGYPAAANIFNCPRGGVKGRRRDLVGPWLNVCRRWIVNRRVKEPESITKLRQTASKGGRLRGDSFVSGPALCL
jgi:hypothetical protein